MALAKKAYVAPIFLASGGNIDITDSQEGEWGGGGNTDYSSFWNWWNTDPDVLANKEFILAAGFDPNNKETWAAFGFDPNNEETWYGLFDYI